MKSIKYLLFITFTIFLFIGCKESSVNEPEPYDKPAPPNSNSDLKFILPVTLDSSNLHNVMNDFDDYSVGFDYYDLSKVLMHSNTNNLVGYVPSLWYSKINYTSVGNDGQPRELSGLLIYPFDVSNPFKKFSRPIVSFNHATNVLRKFSPSKWSITSNPEDFPEVVIAAGLALKNGWCVIMPDYQGMGDDNTEFHPFCNKELLGKAVADLCVKTIAYLKSSSNNTAVTWNEQLFMMGYSEGAYATMAGVRELESRNINVTGAACLSGPYDLTGTMLPLMLGPNPFPVPYFLPYMIMGYNAVPANGKSFDPQLVIKPQYLNGILQTMDMNHSPSEINTVMPQSKILRELFNENFIDSLNNPNSTQYQILYKNNMWVDWTPKSKMLVAHGMNDDCVVYGNYLTFKSKHQLPNIQYFELGETFKILDFIHDSMAPWAFLQGSLWIQQMVK